MVGPAEGDGSEDRGGSVRQRKIVLSLQSDDLAHHIQSGLMVFLGQQFFGFNRCRSIMISGGSRAAAAVKPPTRLKRQRYGSLFAWCLSCPPFSPVVAAQIHCPADPDVLSPVTFS